MAQKVKCDKIKVGKKHQIHGSGEIILSTCSPVFSTLHCTLHAVCVASLLLGGKKKKAVAKVNVFWCPLVWLITVEVDLSRAKSFINMERKSVAFLLNDLGVWIKLKHPDTLFSGGH